MKRVLFILALAALLLCAQMAPVVGETIGAQAAASVIAAIS